MSSGRRLLNSPLLCRGTSRKTVHRIPPNAAPIVYIEFPLHSRVDLYLMVALQTRASMRRTFRAHSSRRSSHRQYHVDNRFVAVQLAAVSHDGWTSTSSVRQRSSPREPPQPHLFKIASGTLNKRYVHSLCETSRIAGTQSNLKDVREPRAARAPSALRIPKTDTSWTTGPASLVSCGNLSQRRRRLT
ncbi:hypothetical protein BV25DRAFT_353491 [Artomyces pyxidatus]|uniref:Uncharacterized protein n=1 Tax=Artomyces pyxidatus TaxID=48021 RepID=A0ACB8T4G5_9AGAM|nr:hypothetical protein BV25DRAFT_353491 [Artomyces pyxidatus]